MTNIFLNRFQVKDKDLAAKDKGSEKIEELIRQDIQSAREKLSSVKEVMYNDTEITEMLVSQLRLKKSWREKYGKTMPDLKDTFSDIYDIGLTKWRWDEKPEFVADEGGVRFSAGFHTDFIEISEFKGEFKIIPDTKFGSFIMTKGSPIGLIFLFSPYGYDSKFKKVIRLLLPPRDEIKTIQWDDSGLRSILAEDSATLKGISASGIDGDVKVSASSPNLDSRPFSQAVNGGNYYGISYESKKYPGNLVKIHAKNGSFVTDLEETKAIGYFKEVLMKYSI